MDDDASAANLTNKLHKNQHRRSTKCILEFKHEFCVIGGSAPQKAHFGSNFIFLHVKRFFLNKW